MVMHICSCITPSIQEHGVGVSPIFNITITDLSIAQLATAPFKWARDSSPWVSMMSYYPSQLHKKYIHMFNIALTKLLSLLNEFSTFANISMISCKKPILSTNTVVISIGFHVSFKRETRFGCNCRDPSKALATSL